MAHSNPPPEGGSLADRGPGQLTTGLLVLVTCLLPLGLVLPALETTHFAFWRDEHSILSFGIALWSGGEYLLSGLVLAFSVVFPGIKLVWMWRLQFNRRLPPTRARLRVLETLGKWSMADVLVIAMVVFSFRGNLVFGATPLPGVYVFALATVLAMLASGRIVHQLERRLNRRAEPV